jgi:hypothetical protein
MGDSASGGFAGILAGFGPVQKVLLFLGFAVFCTGVPKGFTLTNTAMVTGAALMAGGIAGHYWSTCRYGEICIDGEWQGGEWNLRVVILALAFSGLCVASAILAYFSN